jgi:hypothetical protein
MVRVCSLRDVVTLTWRSTLSRDVLKRQWTYLSVYVILSYEYIFYPNAVSGFCCLVRSTPYIIWCVRNSTTRSSTVPGTVQCSCRLDARIINLSSQRTVNYDVKPNQSCTPSATVRVRPVLAANKTFSAKRTNRSVLRKREIRSLGPDYTAKQNFEVLKFRTFITYCLLGYECSISVSTSGHIIRRNKTLKF